MSNEKLVLPARRTLLRNTGQAVLSASALALLAGCESMAQKSAAGDPVADVRVLNTALGLEYEAIAAYQVGAESGLLQKPVLDVAVQFQNDHKRHAETLFSTIAKLGGTAVTPKARYDFPVQNLKNQSDVLRFASGLEKGAASAYLGAVPVLQNNDLSRAAASIMAVEAQHWAILRNALGENPVPASFLS